MDQDAIAEERDWFASAETSDGARVSSRLQRLKPTTAPPQTGAPCKGTPAPSSAGMKGEYVERPCRRPCRNDIRHDAACSDQAERNIEAFLARHGGVNAVSRSKA